MTADTSVRLALWRDRDPAARRIPGMYLGETDLLGDPLDAVERLAASGVRFARLRGTVDLAQAEAGSGSGSGSGGAAAVAALVVVRELTGHGIAVDWTVRLPAGGPGWRPLGHLHPPADVLGAGGGGDVTAAWRDTFHAAKCGYRHGPGFIEVRDHRMDTFRRLVIRNPQHEQIVEPLLRGVPATDLAEAVSTRYQRAGLLHRAGGHLWWAPYRLRRWPLSTTVS
ncbi:DUF5825 family protein [Streptomyces yaizuensis]|uniref:DUF5825 family protein n=1 Tax=Streptomyces yaizuensis TaxID=2989713 RepID=A0ABQ5NX33_9ACTN|nr:DUF5825 family protein [Streptomyces sp. YSPA8]GLF94917.1 DUF5825 family protein [Streptomyces sp. YSPA8]